MMKIGILISFPHCVFKNASYHCNGKLYTFVSSYFHKFIKYVKTIASSNLILFIMIFNLLFNYTIFILYLIILFILKYTS